MESNATSSGFGAGRPRVVSVPLLEIMALVDDITERDEPSGFLCRWLSCVAPASVGRCLGSLPAAARRSFDAPAWAGPHRVSAR